jgi:exopolyphosphatase
MVIRNHRVNLVYPFFALFLVRIVVSRIPGGMLKQFLTTSKSAVLEISSNTFTKRASIVLGNEAADADSIISALTYAYLKESNQVHPPTQSFIPLCSVPKADLILRRDVEVLLQRVGIELNDLLCIDEFPLDQISTINLVDHNILALPLSFLGGKVSEIVDHHQDMNRYPEVNGDARECAFEGNTATVGSCCTLIAERYMSQNPSILNDEVATLLMGVITLDTGNMSPVVAKGTGRDQNMLDVLSHRSSSVLSELYDVLKNAKNDPHFWSSLSAADAMRVDYKAFQLSAMKASSVVGIASVLLPIQEFKTKPDFSDSSANLLNGLEFLVVMTFYTSPSPTREVAILSRSEENIMKAIEYCIIRGEDFNFTEISGLEKLNENCFYVSFSQGNVKMSRKQFAPFFLGFF